ncbi:MAG: hypothetical protein RLZZ496_1867 [Pseudomonadota bacterium]|jgi:hypothetical protein
MRKQQQLDSSVHADQSAFFSVNWIGEVKAHSFAAPRKK